jgi:hypothetical protein
MNKVAPALYIPPAILLPKQQGHNIGGSQVWKPLAGDQIIGSWSSPDGADKMVTIYVTASPPQDATGAYVNGGGVMPMAWVRWGSGLGTFDRIVPLGQPMTLSASSVEVHTMAGFVDPERMGNDLSFPMSINYTSSGNNVGFTYRVGIGVGGGTALDVPSMGVTANIHSGQAPYQYIYFQGQPGLLHSVQGFNYGSTDGYVNIADQFSGVINPSGGNSTTIVTIPAPAGKTFSQAFSRPFQFASGLLYFASAAPYSSTPDATQTIKASCEFSWWSF